jgi:hypothetical protein
MLALRRVSRAIYGVVSSVPEGGSMSPIGLSFWEGIDVLLSFFFLFSLYDLKNISQTLSECWRGMEWYETDGVYGFFNEGTWLLTGNRT